MGKNKYIETPEKLWEYFCLYRDSIKSNPIYVVEQKKSSTNIKLDGETDVLAIRDELRDASKPIVELPMQRPLTLEGFENWCFENEIINDLGDYFSNKDKKYSDYSTICTRIRSFIRQDQIEGGMVGIYNPSITQRLNGLVEKKETEIKGTLNVPKIPDIGNRK